MPTLQSSIFDSCNEEALQGATTSIPLTASESVSTQSAFFNQRLAPLAHAAASRIKLKKGWEVVIAWAVAYNATLDILPMGQKTLEAIMTHLIACGCSGSQIKEVWNGIIAQHRKLHLPSPLDRPKTYARYWKVVAPLRGHHRLPKTPLFAAHIQAMLRQQPTTLAAKRDKLAVTLATVRALRPAEVIALQTCDVWFDYDCEAYPGPLYQGTAAINIRHRKNDQAAKGHYPRVGKASQPQYDIVRELSAYILQLGNPPAMEQCTKQNFPSKVSEMLPALSDD